MSAVHTLIITFHSDCPDMEPTDVDYEIEPDYEIECPGVTAACRMWEECDVRDCPGRTGNGDWFWDNDMTAHGQEHQYIDGSWMVPTDTCYVTVADNMPDAADYLATREKLGPGRYQVGHDFDDGRIADLHLVAQEDA